MTTKPTISKELDEIFNTYGFFMGLAYEDKKGILAVHKQGVVKQKILELIADQQRQLLDRVLEQKVIVTEAAVTSADGTIGVSATAVVPVQVINDIREGL